MFATLITWVWLVKKGLWRSTETSQWGITMSGGAELFFWIWLIGSIFGKW